MSKVIEEEILEDMLHGISSANFQNTISYIGLVYSDIDESDYSDEEKEQLMEYFRSKVKEDL